MINFMGNFEGGIVEAWEVTQEIRRLEEKIEFYDEKIFDAKMQKRTTKLYKTLKREYTKKLNYLLGGEF